MKDIYQLLQEFVSNDFNNILYLRILYLTNYLSMEP